jgi:hypothetical protein
MTAAAEALMNLITHGEACEVIAECNAILAVAGVPSGCTCGEPACEGNLPVRLFKALGEPGPRKATHAAVNKIVCPACSNFFFIPRGSDEFLPKRCCYCDAEFAGCNSR